jgi:hypothetical protein
MNIVKKFNGHDVRFNEQGWLNATHLAEKYEKRLDNWLTSPETRAYVEALSKSLDYSDLIVTKRGNGGGTWPRHPRY